MTPTEGLNVSVWAWFFVEIVIGLGLIGAGATIVRRAHAGSGYALIFAGLLNAGWACCCRVYGVIDSSEMRVEALHEALDVRLLLVFELLQAMLMWIAIAVALAMLANQIRKKKNPGPREF
jgi:hypothetical protein